MVQGVGMMEWYQWIKRNGLTTLIIAGMLGIYGFFIEARYLLKSHDEAIKELKDDVENIPKRIMDEVKAREFFQRMEREGVKRDTTGMTIKLKRK